jgi:hypothetical protein
MTTFNVGGTVQIEATLADGRVKTTPGQSLKIDVEGFKYDIGGKRGTYDGATAQSVTDDTTSRVYIDSDGTLQIKTTAQQATFPTDSHIPLARIVAANGEIAQIYNETVLLAASSAEIGTCCIAFPVDAGVRGGNASTSSNNSVASVTFAAAGESRNRWNFRPPQNYISGDLTFRVLCSVAGSPGSNGVRMGLKWMGITDGDTIPSSYTYTSDQTKSLSGISNDELFKIDFTMAEAQFDNTEDLYAIYFLRDGDHADDTSGLILHTHLCELRYSGYLVAGQSGQ